MPDLSSRFSIQRPYHSREQAPDSYLVGRCGVRVLEKQLESDRGRIINSAAVRRLQQKTQVFPLEHNAAVRSRLTHSLEVQQTGRFIVRTIFEQLGDRATAYGLDGLERATETLVEMACLMHDIGNPPFGHFGEEAISHWFERVLPELSPFSNGHLNPQQTALRGELLRELSSFEGNAQAIRLISQLQKLNLTYLQTACIFKYTRCATEAKPAKGSPLAYLKKKPGYYFSERKFVAGMQEALDMVPGHRFPLTYLMEAADDIAYCMADLEDGVDKEILTCNHLAALLKAQYRELRAPFGDADAPGFRGKSFADLIDSALGRWQRESINKEHEFFVSLRVGLIHPLVEHAASRFVDNIDAVFEGNLNRALLEDDSPCHAVVETLKRVAIRHVFSVAEVETLELQGYRIISGLLEHYKPLLMLTMEQFERLYQGDKRGLLIESRLFHRLPPKHVKAYLSLLGSVPWLVDGEKLSLEVWERYCRCRLLQDMISGMTDQFALDEYKALSVIGS
ncbi:putative deoxyguanosinetriphosphate triphosphohydrolase [Marinobacterium zhoushanense]|uniref:Probable deoxyguanosinetriphosphate triphosphohydrolase n=1 Tax=Marinobacterium zhoushanense TaxID=1679163 RepID=A0ABQ1JVE8_9GAMM|nr:dGTPase [Marinobacterium zhoushanense]GGB78977.1 putative deoxyguanosinetriphosphate triphosphohydrolase [Marinobacterium zhoushanense]